MKTKIQKLQEVVDFLDNEVIPMLEFCGYGGRNQRREEAHIRKAKKLIALSKESNI